VKGHPQTPATLLVERAPSATEQEAGWAPGFVWNTLDKISCLCWDSNPHHPARSLVTAQILLSWLQKMLSC